MKTTVIVLAAAIICGGGHAKAEDQLAGKKLIEWGWDEPDTKFIRENVERMEQFPFDGFVFHALSNKGGRLTWEMWGKRKFELEEFRHSIENLKATKFRRFTDPFLRVNVTPGNVDWFDDDAWSVVQHNFGVAARVAGEGRCKGFMFDVEQYQSSLFDYRRGQHKDSKSFADYQAKVRQRGGEWMRAVNRQFPDITILLTFGYSIAQPKGQAEDRSGSRYGLLADFLDGMLDTCSENTTIVDAWEHSYPYKQRKQFEDAYATIKTKSLSRTSVPKKYRRHVRAGFGIWMDYAWRSKGWNVEDVSKNHFTPADFERSVRSALRVSDKYVWIYTEQPRWWTNQRLPKAYVDAARNASKNNDH